MIAPDHIPSEGLEELAALIHFQVGAWQDLGYEDPPSPDCKTIPPLGERSASAITAGHEAIEDIDRLIRQLHDVRSVLVSQLRRDEDIRTARTFPAAPEPLPVPCGEYVTRVPYGPCTTCGRAKEAHRLQGGAQGPEAEGGAGQ